MLDFSDQPYRYVPPRYSRLWSRLILYHNRTRLLPRTQRITRVEVEGWDALCAAIKPGDRLLILPNHSTHADAPILLEALRQVGQRCMMMAAYDVFLRGFIHRFAMQRMGAFAVNRDANDPKPIKQALEVLDAGKFALALFPEGNVYLTNDRVTPFLDGAAFIGLKAQGSLMERSIRVMALPVSIKATHLTNARERIAQRFDPLAKQLGVEADLRHNPLDALQLAGAEALRRNLRQRGIDTPIGDTLPRMIQHAAASVLDRLEFKLQVTPKPGDTLMDRIRAARRVIHEVRTDPDRSVDHAAAATWADEAMLAFRIASYPESYAGQNPTIDRIGETVEKLEEDLLTRMPPPFADRQATVRFNPPLDLRDYLVKGQKLRESVRRFTADCEASVQQGLDTINRENPHPGGQAWA